MDLFAYGTLIFPEVMEAVLNRRPPMRPAALEDHAALQVRGAPYPGLAPRPGVRAAGILWEGLSEADLAALDAYEGDGFTRRAVEVVCRGTRRPALVYVPAPGREPELTGAPWDPAGFRRSALAAWLRSVRERAAR